MTVAKGSQLVLGVNTGGTFTDFVYHDGHSLTVHKQLSTPHAPEQTILSGLANRISIYNTYA